MAAAEADAFECTFENTSELIGLYENLLCRYDVRRKDYYKNRDVRDKASAVIAILLRTMSKSRFVATSRLTFGVPPKVLNMPRKTFCFPAILESTFCVFFWFSLPSIHEYSDNVCRAKR